MKENLNQLLYNTQTLYYLTQYYHWHVNGPQFQALHNMFEVQYTELAMAVDEIAERILTIEEEIQLQDISISPLKNVAAGDLVKDLIAKHNEIISHAKSVISQDSHDIGSIDLFTQRLSAHEKTCWMLKSSL